MHHPLLPHGTPFVGMAPNVDLSASAYIANQVFAARVAASTSSSSSITSAEVEAVGYWSPLTNGDPVTPELVFDGDGDCIMVWNPT